MFLKFSKDDHTKTYAKSIKSLQKIMKNHPYISSLKLSLVKLLILLFQFTSNSLNSHIAIINFQNILSFIRLIKITL